MKKVILGILGTLLLLNMAWAEPLSQLYEGDVEVGNMTPTAREAAMQQAMRQVLVKVSGDSAIASNSSLNDDILQASDAVEQFNYYTRRYTALDGNEIKSLNLKVKFDHDIIDRLVTKTKLHVWNKQRPMTLAWIAVQTADGRQLIGSNSEHAITEFMLQDAKHRGVPLLMPSLDLQDLNTVSANEVWNFNVDVIQKASMRYAVEVILIGNVKVDANGMWHASWMGIWGDKKVTWQTQDIELHTAITLGVARLAENLSSQFVAPGKPGSEWATLTISDIKDFHDFERVKQYLKDLSVVSHLETDSIERDYAIFHLQVNGGVTALLQAISVEHHLLPVKTRADLPAHKLHFQWIG